MASKITPPLSPALFVWGLGILFYMMAYFQRMAPAVMTEELMRDFNVSAAGLGNLSGFYFYSYAIMQIPTGLLSDMWGPRRLLSLGSLVAGIGILIFSLAPHILWANIGRFLIGGSVAVAFVGCLKVSMNWFEPRYYALLSGMTLLCGLVGAVVAGPVLRLIMNHYGWRVIFLWTAVMTFISCASIWIFIRDYPHEKGYDDTQIYKVPSTSHDRTTVIADLYEVLSYRNIVPLIMSPGGIVGCQLTFTGLWGVPYLATHYGLLTSQAAMLTSSMLVAWGIGCPVFGWLSDRMGNRKYIYLVGCVLSLAGYGTVFFVPNLPLIILFGLLLMTGFSSGCVILGFAFARESVSPSLSGTVTGIYNTGMIIGPTIMQPAVGWILDAKWRGTTMKGIHIYGLDAYQAGFSLMIAWAVLSVIMLLLTRDTQCRQVV